jgi:hypothetical protein
VLHLIPVQYPAQAADELRVAPHPVHAVTAASISLLLRGGGAPIRKHSSTSSDLVNPRSKSASAVWALSSSAVNRARGRKGGRKFALTKAQVRLAQAAMAQRDTSVSDLCKELAIERVTLYRYVGPKGELRDYGKRVLGLT